MGEEKEGYTHPYLSQKKKGDGATFLCSLTRGGRGLGTQRPSRINNKTMGGKITSKLRRGIRNNYP